MRIVVSVDTEADGQWEHGRPLSTENVAAWPPFQELCQRVGAAPTYLVTSEIAEDPAAAAYLRPLAASGAAEVGAHLHPWTTPPFEQAPGLSRNDAAHAYPCHLPHRLLRAKLATLTAQVEAAIGARPTSYRAGRFGLDADGAIALAELGYVIDSSVTPFVSWHANPGLSGRGGGPDFRRYDAYPFRIAGTGQPELVELPVTILPTNALTRRFGWLRDHWQAQPLRLAHRALRLRPRSQPLWFRPRPEYSLADLQALLLEAERRRLPYAVLMFHSSELLAGASPYRPSPADIDDLLDLLERLFGWARERGHGFSTLTAAGRALAAFDQLPGREL
jgi:hypothetical protein